MSTLHRVHPLPRALACKAALAAAALVACGDDLSGASSTSDASATATTSTTTGAAASAASATSATGAGESDSGSTSGAGETTTPATTIATDDPSSSSTVNSDSATDTAATDTDATDTAAACEPGATEPCYSGPDGTQGVGLCVAGARTCDDEGTGFGPCEGEITPTAEICETEADEDCLGDAPECGAVMWKRRFGGAASDEGSHLAVGPDDGVVITGVFDTGSSINFGGATFVNKGSFDGFIASFDGDGAHRWSRAFGSASTDSARSVAIDSAGAVILTGDTQGALDFGGGLLTSVDQDVFVAKFNSQGGHLWSTIYKSPQQQIGLRCAVTSGDEVILGGVFRGSIDLGGGAMVSAGMSDIYLTKLSAAGQHLWSKRFGDAAVDHASVTVVGPGDVIVQAGFFAGALNYGGGALSSAGGNDAFIAKLDDKGGHLWSKRFGDAEDQRVEAAAIAADGRVLIAGIFRGAINFGGQQLVNQDPGMDGFIAVFDGGGAHQWSRQIAGPGSDRVNSIAVDPDGNIVVGGVFAGSVDVGGQTLSEGGLYSAFFAKYDPTGALLLSASYGSNDRSWLSTVAADSLGRVFLLGPFAGTIDIDGPMTSAGDDDVYLAKIAP